MNKINDKRIFIAIPIGTAIKPVLHLLKSKFTRNSENIKWISMENIHLTLYFAGNIPNHYIPILIQTLKNNIIANSFKLIIESTGIFSSSQSPKILWMGIKRGNNELISLHTQIKESLKVNIDNVPEKTFTPHVTIGKLLNNFVKIDVLPFLNTVYSPIELSINSICLFESKLSPERAKYIMLHEFPLNR